MRWMTVTAVLVSLALPRQGQACGVWRLRDNELKRTATFYITTTLVTLGSNEKGRSKLAVRIDGKSTETMHGFVDDRLRVDFKKTEKGTELRAGKRLLGMVDESAGLVRFGASEYRIAISPIAKPARIQLMRWQVDVRRADAVIASGTAMSLCLDGPPRDKPDAAQLEQEQQEIRRRVALYLAWRHLQQR